MKKMYEIFFTALKLGITSFGGPVAHIGYFHNEYVDRKKWIDEESFADMVALCQFLPGPASSQLGIAVGTKRAGIAGGFFAWLGFTLPSAFFLILFAVMLKDFGFAEAAWIEGLKIVALVIVAQAVISMWKRLIKNSSQALISVLSMAALLFMHTSVIQLAVLFAAGGAGLVLFRNIEVSPEKSHSSGMSRKTGTVCLALFFALLLFLPALREYRGLHYVELAESFYRSGSLVFGGGHVVLPLLELEVVPSGWISRENFLAGYGAAQAVPGPLFTFSAYLGAMINGIPGAFTALFSIFLPAFLLINGALPFWEKISRNPRMRAALDGINAAVIGILLAALYDPVWTSSIYGSADMALAAVLFYMLMIKKMPPWVIVLAGAAGKILIVSAGFP